jgi:TolB-like protein
MQRILGRRKAGLLLLLLMTLPVSAQDLNQLCSKLAARISTSGRKTVAVVDFTDLQGNVTELGRYLAEEFSISLFETAKDFRVIDRSHLQALIQEHKLSSTGIIDPQTAKRLGQIAGADALVTGNITPFGDTIKLSVKVLDTSTATLVGASSADVARTKAIDELLSRGISSGSSAPMAPPSASQRGQTPTSSSGVSVDNSRFLFVIRKCLRSDRTVACSGSITNKGAKRRKVIIDGYNVYATDDLGNPYRKGEIIFGSRGWEQEMEPELEMVLTVRVEDVEPGATSLNLIVPYIYEERDPNRTDRPKVALRNIPLQ